MAPGASETGYARLSAFDGGGKPANVDTGSASLFGTIANIMKAVLGAGILTLSWAFYYSSLAVGIVLTVVFGLASAYSCYMLGVSSARTGQASYSKAWGLIFGPRLAWLPDLASSVFCVASNVSYLIIVGDYVPKACAGLGITWEPLLGRRECILLASALTLPLSLLRDLSFLGYTSLLGTAFALYATLLLVGETSVVGGNADWDMCSFQPGLFVTIPAIAFAFNGHFSVPAMYQQLRDRSPSRWLLVTSVSFGALIPITLACGISGYLMFGSDLALPGHSNVLNAPELEGKAEVYVGYLATALSVTLSVPLYSHGARNGIDFLVQYFAGTGPASVGMLRCLTVVEAATELAVAVSVTDLGLVVALNGAVCACLIMFVFPSLMYLRCCEDANRYLAGFVLVIGAAAGLAGVVTTLMLGAGMSSSLRW